MLLLNQVIAIKNHPDLYKSVGKTKGGLIVESLADGRRFPLTGDRERLTNLSAVSIYTTDGKMPLHRLFSKIKAHGPVPEITDDDSLRTYFTAVCPEHDATRVFPSEMKKIIRWFAMLEGKIDFASQPATVMNGSNAP